MSTALLEPRPSLSEGSSEHAVWHIDRRIPIALVLSILIQTAVFGVWVGRTEGRLTALEQFQQNNRMTDARLAVIESRLDGIRDALAAIDRKLATKGAVR